MQVRYSSRTRRSNTEHHSVAPERDFPSVVEQRGDVGVVERPAVASPSELAALTLLVPLPWMILESVELKGNMQSDEVLSLMTKGRKSIEALVTKCSVSSCAPGSGT